MSSQPASTSERGRVIRWIARHPRTCITGVICFFVVLAVLTLQVRAIRVEERLRSKIAAIRARGEPTTLQDLIALQHSIRDDQNMVVQLVAAIGPVRDEKLTEEELRLLPRVGNANPLPTGQRWPAEKSAVARSYIEKNAAIFSSLHAALKLQRGRLRVAWRTPAQDTPMPELGDIRRIARMLALEAEAAANTSDIPRVEACITDMLSLTSDMLTGGAIIHALVQTAVNSLVQDTIERCISITGLSEPVLAEIQRHLRESETTPDMRKAFLNERVLFLNTGTWIRQSKTPSVADWIPTSSDDLERLVTPTDALDISAGLDALTEFSEAVTDPSSAIRKVCAIDQKFASLPSYCVMTDILYYSGFRKPVMLWLRGIGSNRALQAAVAAERFRLVHSRWPERLAELKPDFFDSVPLDPIDGQPIRYAIIPEGIKTWTISDDDQNADDGGDVRRLEKYDSKKTPKDRGWVILNPELRGRPATTQGATSGRAGK